jgi:peptidoglycan/xylan/chitin deacetylase (PgdA/CDA1 family)
MRGWLAGLALLLLAAATPASAEDVALTFDDLPTLSLSSSTVYAEATTRDLLKALRRQRIVATGFVNEGKLEGPDRARRIALLSHWLDAGMDLGNHSYSHLSLTDTPVQAYIEDVAKGERVTRALLAERGRTPRWYRHPYLETGRTPQVRQQFEGWLAGHGYRVAPVTMENSDWMYALPYDEAVLEGDWPAARAIQKSYLDFTAQIVPWYRQAAQGVLGRRPAFVFLLHASRLNADSLDGLADILRANGLSPVSLDQAMADPAYAIADGYAGPDGNQWVTRWATVLRKDMPWRSLPAPSAQIAAQDARLEDMPGEPPPVKAGQ